MPVQNKEVSVFLPKPSATQFITVAPNDTVNPDQAINLMFIYVTSMSWRGRCVREKMANAYIPSDKLCRSAVQFPYTASASSTGSSDIHSYTDLKCTNNVVI